MLCVLSGCGSEGRVVGLSVQGPGPVYVIHREGVLEVDHAGTVSTIPWSSSSASRAH